MVTDVWRQLWSYLEVRIDTTVDTSLGTEKPVVMNLVVTNTSPRDSSWPDIVYKDVTLKVGKSPSLEAKNLGSLSRGESATFEYRCSYPDSPDVKHEMTATISPEDVFRVRLGPGHPNLGQRFPLIAYVQMFNHANIHKWLNSTIKGFPVPGPDTTLAQIDALRRPVNQAFVEIDEPLSRLSRISDLVNDQYRELVGTHRKSAENYLTGVKHTLSELTRALSSDPRSIARTVEGVLEHSIRRLENQATEVEKATINLSQGRTT